MSLFICETKMLLLMRLLLCTYSFSPVWVRVVCFSDSWVHCNDTKMQMVSIDDVYKAQAYILIYTRRFDNENQLNETSNGKTSNTFAEDNASRIPKYCDLRRKLNRDAQSSFMWKKRKTTIWWYAIGQERCSGIVCIVSVLLIHSDCSSRKTLNCLE